MAENKREEEIGVTIEQIKNFLNDLEQKGRSSNCVQSYGTTLLQLYTWLPEDKLLNEERIQEWREWLIGQNYSVRTINARMSGLNHFLQYLGKKEWQMDHCFYQPDSAQLELTRTEYKRLLQAAKQLEKEQAYFLIKVMGGAGIRSQELYRITVEALQKEGEQSLYIPAPLRQELLSYARRKRILKGPVFQTQEGKPLTRYSVWQYVKAVSRDARVDEEKATPRCLWKMHQKTYAVLQSDAANLVRRAYEQIVEEEQLIVGWEV